MSELELVNLLRQQLDEDSDTFSQSDRERKVSLKGNEVLAQNVGVPVHQYLDTTYADKVKEICQELFEERIKKLEEKVASLEKKVK